MKKLWIVCAIFVMLLVSGCGNQEHPEIPNETPDQQVETEPQELGETVVFQPINNEGQPLDLKLKISHVKEIKHETAVLDESETWEYDVYVVYPGAAATVVTAGTFIDAEGLTHANWAFLTADNQKIEITEGMEPLEITQNILGIPDESVYVLGFEMYPGD